MRLGFQKHKGEHAPDYFLMFLVLFLLVFGLVMVLSVSPIQSFQNFGNNYYYFYHQLLYGAVPGLIAFFVLSRIDYHKFQKWALPIFVVALALLTAVLLTSPVLKGAKRWVHVGPLFFQPTELVKFALILYLAAWFAKVGPEVKTWKRGLLPFVIIVGAISVLLLRQPDLGSLIITTVISLAMYFVAGASWIHLGVMGLGGAAALGYLISIAPYRVARLTIFLNPELDPKGKGYQVSQALLTIGTGGIFGLGLGNDLQKYNYLPEATTDSIFAIIAEEFGFLGALVFIGLFIFLAVRGYTIAKNAPDVFGRYLAVGITTWLVFQAFMNIAAITGLMPLTGIPLPFVSYGSSALITLMAGAGILLNISRYAHVRSSRVAAVPHSQI